MDHGTHDSTIRQSGSFRQTISRSSSLSRRSFRTSSAAASHIDDRVERESCSEAGDIGDRSLPSNRYSESGSLRLSIENALEDGLDLENNVLQSSHDLLAPITLSAVTPLPENISSPIATKPSVCSEDKRQVKKTLPKSWEYMFSLVHLAFFGALGVLTRYGLQKAYGPNVAGVTNVGSILYLDLPSNLLGSFLMGWFGVVFKEDISAVSPYLAIGLSTGYLGSLTTFSGWNQKILDLALDGHWVFASFGLFLGLLLADRFIILGVETAKGFRRILKRLNTSSTKETPKYSSNWKVDTFKGHLALMLAFMLALCALLTVCVVLLVEHFNDGGSEAQLLLACIVGPPGVWIRWFLARLNGRGLGKAGTLKWIPFGTLIANVSAACVMAALATVKEVVDTKDCYTVASGVQLGFLGCLSTVSTFMAEFNAMRGSEHPWRAYAYALITILPSFSLGILIYCIPVWALGYN